MLAVLILIPVLAGAAGFLLRSNGIRRGVLLLAAASHGGLTLSMWIRRPGPLFGGWLLLDAQGLLFLTVTSILFLAASLYAVGYLRQEVWGERQDFEEGFLFSNAREAVFTGCLLFFLAMMTLVTVSQHFGLLWVAVEATTLASAPLIYFHRHRRSLEATWKYILICSVGIALALLGTFFLSVACSLGREGHTPMLLTNLIGEGRLVNLPWLKAAFLFLLVGYGTKMGLAPMHTWLPDAHSEAPSVISALLSGALLNCAFLAVLRMQQVCAAAGEGPFGRKMLLLFGFASMTVAALFIVRQGDFKRMLAYSSVEHMGILSLAVGIGGGAGFGAMLHAVNHSLTKGMLFLVAGNILAAYKTKSTTEVQGVLRVLPISGILWVAGFLAIAGSPPFGLFLSELIILKAAMDQGHIWMATGYLALLSVVFIGLATIMLRMAQGVPVLRPGGRASAPEELSTVENPHVESLLAIAPPLALGALVLILGLYLPAGLQNVLEEAARAITG